MYNDLRFILRQLRQNPGFTAVVVLTLALGIGANTAVFSVLDQVLLRLLPVKKPQELVLLAPSGSHYGNSLGANTLSYPMYLDLRDHSELSQTVFQGLLCRFASRFSLTFAEHTERVAGELVSGNYFRVLGVGAALGRTLTPDDDRTPGAHPLVVLTYNFWKTRFASDPAILGKTLIVNGNSLTIVGVSEARFEGVELGFSPQLFVPIQMKARLVPDPTGFDLLRDRRTRWVNVFGRLQPGITAAQSKAALAPVFYQILAAEVREAAFRNASPYMREQFLKMTMDVLPGSQGRSSLREQADRPLWILMAIVGVMLLSACANVAALLIARATSRQKEMVVRLALGASRYRLMRQLLAENFVLSFSAGLLGLLVALWTAPLLLRFLPQDESFLNLSIAPDVYVLGFTLGVSSLVALLLSLAPALPSLQFTLMSGLKEQTGASTGGGHLRIRKLLVIAQVSVSLLLLVAAGLLVQSLRNLKAAGPGFPTVNLIGFNLDPSLNGYSSERCKLFYQELQRNLSSLPGVRSVALASIRILEDNQWDSSVTVEGSAGKPGEELSPYFNSVSPGYFLTMGIPLLAGRDFTLQDTGTIPHQIGFASFDSPRVVMVNESLARHCFGERSPLGRRLGFGDDPNTKADMEIIGVVKDVKYANLRDEVPQQVFTPYLAFPFVTAMTGYVRTTLEPNQVFSAIRAEVRKLDSNVPVYAMRTLEAQIDRSLTNERLVASLSSVFSTLVVLLSMVGLYGVLAFTIVVRTREIGIRIALGALGVQVLRMMLGQGLKLVLIGLMVGLVAAWSLTRILSSFLFGVTATDLTVFAGATLGLGIVALLACYIPARRATRVDPVVALRCE
ncbi:MAG: ABC transporter permease [Acidobacteriota bacterium]